jgi:glycosyltransferase involved in cell wall biosynthesis
MPNPEVCMALCEIRVPTFQRPQLLAEALRSLQAQTLREWHAVVLDDSPGREGEAVVAGLRDARIAYRPNETNLGCAGNLDRAFQKRAYTTAEFACVLEDDNLLAPPCLEANLKELKLRNVVVLLRNQEIKSLSSGARTPTGRTTRGCLFQDGIYSADELKASLFLGEGISNGGLFWSFAAKSSLEVGPLVTDSGLQEYCRTLQIIEPLAFASEPLAIWTEMSTKSSFRSPVANRVFGRGIQSILRHLLKRYGRDVVDRAVNLAYDAGMEAQCRRALAEAVNLPSLARLPWTPGSLSLVMKSLARLLLVADPLKNYLATVHFVREGQTHR